MEKSSKSEPEIVWSIIGAQLFFGHLTKYRDDLCREMNIGDIDWETKQDSGLYEKSEELVNVLRGRLPEKFEEFTMLCENVLKMLPVKKKRKV